MIASFPFLASSFDNDARTFINTSGAADRAAINHFVKGIKRLGLWDDMVCWPLRSAQNAGTGSTAYSLGGLGTYNGTLVNGPTWGVDGIDFAAASTQHISTTLELSGTQNCTFFASLELDDAGASVYAVMGTRIESTATTRCVFTAKESGATMRASFVIGPTADIARPSGVLSGTCAFEPITPVARIGANGGAYTSATPSPAPAGGTQEPLYLGAAGESLGTPFNGTINLAAAFADTSLAQSQSLALHNLYKSTLGQGLGLP
jgi:hypothetical protein